VLAGVIVFPFFYVLVAEVIADSNQSSGMFYFVPELVGIGILLLLAFIIHVSHNRISIEATFVVVHPIFVTAMLLLPLFWGNEVFISGILIKCGFLLYNALLWSFLAKQAFGSQRKAFLYFGIATGMYDLFALLGRAVGLGLHTLSWIQDGTIAYVSLIVVWALAMSLLVFFLLVHKRKNDLLIAVQDENKKLQNQDRFIHQCQILSEKFGLSKRETEVLAEFARGRSASYIATTLFISKETTKTHLKRIYAKVNVHSRQELLDLIEQMDPQ
jgi:DNA-binding CsgD family transcriptional regulator